MTDQTGTDLEQRQQGQPPALVRHINDLAPQLARLGVDEQRFTRTLLSAVQENRDLLQCTPASFMAAAFHSAQLGLEPGKLEQVWLIPRRNSKQGTVEVQFMLGYRGMVELARRVGVLVTANIVYTGDHFREQQGSDPFIEHTPVYDDERGEPYLWYAVARFPDGRTIHRVLDKSDVEKRRKHSDSGKKGKGPWASHYDQMARKSAVRALWSELPADPQIQRAGAMDEQVLTLPTVREAPGRPEVTAAAAIQDRADDGAEPETSGSSTSDEAPEPAAPAPEEIVDTRSLAELRDACGKAGLSKQGSRGDLFERLAAADGAEDVHGEVVDEGPPMPPPPDEPDDAPVDAVDAEDDDQDEDDDVDPTDPQRRKFFALLREHDIDETTRKHWLRAVHRVDSLNDVDRRALAEAIDLLEGADDPPAAFAAAVGAAWRERMVRALQGITSEHPRYVPVWARMVDLVGDPQGVPLPEQVAAWTNADQVEVAALVTEVEALAVEWKAQNR